ncbi:alpha-N-acetylgalactosaminide alpha-2,6-sialyltransferase 6-like [Acanthaster planci]|uniref:Alpha-N-acetylgalactosaminide alpha-2,6-sialyltransferase 6-like n=1 Tax=Acanthaster planci TaxID=133434 RepID=A0A8B7YHY4_ACAPL|nr:alpha-N-acetylgalactosaminide alpha-2,6-sialyltransferase 6-like [Acanthaster planci]XP_022091995.1 alpha-N-acetylgalactosaminide alpha-2,6-sialyltransferase 6-like [Acanthaster planci]
MRKLAACFLGSVVLSSVGSFYLTILVFAPREKTTVKHPYLQYINSTLPPVGGAIRHYRSLLDNEAVTLRCSSCALVSSSGYLLGKGAGNEIDSHSCVIRMNMAPVRGYQNDVGNRTTLQVLNFFMIGLKAEELPPGSRVMVWGLFRRSKYLEKALNLAKRLRAGSTFHGQTVEGEREASALFTKETGQPLGGTNSWLSTGWFTLMIAVDICQETHVYGMVTSDYCANNPRRDFRYHYYSNNGRECSTYRRAETDRGGGHRFMTEKAIFARWALRYNISFRYPDWKLNRDKVLAELDTPFLNTANRNM